MTEDSTSPPSTSDRIQNTLDKENSPLPTSAPTTNKRSARKSLTMPSTEVALAVVKTVGRDDVDAALAPFQTGDSNSSVMDAASVPGPFKAAPSSSSEDVSAARALLDLAPASSLPPVTPPKGLLASLQFTAETPSKTLCDDHTLPLYSPPSILKDSFKR